MDDMRDCFSASTSPSASFHYTTQHVTNVTRKSLESVFRRTSLHSLILFDECRLHQHRTTSFSDSKMYIRSFPQVITMYRRGDCLILSTWRMYVLDVLLFQLL